MSINNNDDILDVNFEISDEESSITANFEIDAGILIHEDLSGRDKPDQHPIGAITGLQEALDSETQGLEEEIQARIDADNALQSSINGVSDNLSDEVAARQNADTSLQELITAEETRATGVEQQLASSINSNHQAISSHVSDKSNPHEVTKSQIGLGNVDNTSDLNKPISTAAQTALNNKVDKVSVANKVYGTDANGTQTTYDVGSFGQVDDVQVGGTSVVTNKIAELGTMAGETASDYSTTAQADLRYATASQGALSDTALQPNDNISELTNNAGYITIASVPTAVSQLTNDSNYQTATQVANSILVETSNRESADNNLQSQIDAIVSSSDVFDIVGTYAELQAYDISTVPVNDIIKVLIDSTHSGAATYYRCVESDSVKSWSYIGSEGAYYTKGEADETFVPQTRTVNNKALSANITLTASDVGADVSGAASTAETNAKNYADGLAVNYATAAQGALAVTAVQPGDLSSYVTKNTAQDITARKTFFGEKAIYFKQNTSSNKLGFTLYDNNNKEVGALEFRPNAIDGTPILTLNSPSPLASGTSRGNSYIGFRYWNYALNILAPFSTSFGYNKNFFIPVTFTNGTTTVESTSTDGSVNISSLLPTKTSDLTNDSGYATESYVTTAVSGKQDTLVSGTNIKTINNTSILGSGNIDIQGGSSYTAGTGIVITNSVISVTGPTLINKSSGTHSLSILGSSSYSYCSVIVGDGASAIDYGVAVGYNATATGMYGVSIGEASQATHTGSIALGEGAISSGNYAIQIGQGGTNSEANSFYVSTSASNNWKMLGSDGFIPSARIAIDGTTITVNSSGQLQASGGGGSSYTAGTGIDITNDVISVTSPTLTNTATNASSITIGGVAATKSNSVNVGISSEAFTNSVAIGKSAIASNNPSIAIGELSTASGSYSIALGEMAKATANYSIQLGYGTNSEASSFYVSTSVSNNWKVLGSDGKIPSDRVSIDGTTITVNSSGQLQASSGSDVEAFTAAEVQTIWDGVS